MNNEEEKLKIIEMQETLLRFPSFNNEDAWKLGSLMVEQAMLKKQAIAIAIVLNGYRVFQYGFQGTNDYNEIWLTRKIKSVSTLHVSSLKLFYMQRTGGEDIYGGGHLDPARYAIMGGGFPIYVQDVGVVGVLAVSGLSHHEDHDTAVDGICQYLGRQVERVLEKK